MLLTLPKGEISPSQRGSQGPPACSCNISSNPTAKPSQARFLPLRADVVFPCAEPGRSCNLRKIKGCFRIPESSIRDRPLHPVVPVRPFHIVLFLQPPSFLEKPAGKASSIESIKTRCRCNFIGPKKTVPIETARCRHARYIRRIVAFESCSELRHYPASGSSLCCHRLSPPTNPYHPSIHTYCVSTHAILNQTENLSLKVTRTLCKFPATW